MGAVKEGYCEDPAWRALLDAYRECAPKYDNIESNYAKDLDAAVKPCNLDAVSSAAADRPASAAPASTPEARSSSAGRESSAAVANATSTAVSSVAGGDAPATSPEAGATQAKASTVRVDSPVARLCPTLPPLTWFSVGPSLSQRRQRRSGLEGHCAGPCRCGVRTDFCRRHAVMTMGGKGLEGVRCRVVCRGSSPSPHGIGCSGIAQGS